MTARSAAFRRRCRRERIMSWFNHRARSKICGVRLYTLWIATKAAVIKFIEFKVRFEEVLQSSTDDKNYPPNRRRKMTAFSRMRQSIVSARYSRLQSNLFVSENIGAETIDFMLANVWTILEGECASTINIFILGRNFIIHINPRVLHHRACDEHSASFVIINECPPTLAVL